MAAGDKHSKTEQPTAKRKRHARKDGRVAKSPEVISWTAVLIASFLVKVIFSQASKLATNLVLSGQSVIVDPQPQNMTNLLSHAFRDMLMLVAPVLLGFMALAVVGNVAQTGFILTTKQIKPSFEKISPTKGFKRMFSLPNLWQIGKSAMKLGVIGLVAVPIVIRSVNKLVAGPPVSITALLPFVAERALQIVRNVAYVALFIAAIDYVLQKRRMSRELRMTKQEVRDEYKQQEGNPEVKSKIRSMQRAMSRNRMIANVGRADVVVVNPVHIAVALRYVASSGAPRVVAKGRGELAERIKDEALEHRVPIVESIALARALYKACELDAEIPVALYEGVARLLAFVHRLRHRGTTPLGGPYHRLPEHLLANAGV